MFDIVENIPSDWREALEGEFIKSYFNFLQERVEEAYSVAENAPVYPPRDQLFTALHLTPLDQVKVVILGQDPYHEPGQAHGLAFSVPAGQQLPPSLRNIYKELEDDLGIAPASHGNLSSWASQGVLLLNTVLTVEAHKANSHKAFGWQNFTDAIISAVAAKDEPVVFILWGKPAQAKRALVKNPKQLILEAPHPSPLSSYRGFFGCKHFSQANEYLAQQGVKPIDWEL